MRPFEWLLILSFIPMVLVPAAPLRWRRRWIGFSVLLIVLAGAVHLIAEGWRIQLAPVYLLAVLVILCRLPELLGRAVRFHRWRGIVLSVVEAVGLIGCAVGAGWLLPVAAMPATTGPYAVGILDREVDAANGRRLMVSIWYPAAQSGPPTPLTHHPDEVAQGLELLSGLPSIGFQHLRYFKVAASEGVPPATKDAPFPVLVFSHGMVGLRMQNASMMQDLASWGYIIVAIDHTNAAAATVFPDGQAEYYDLTRLGVPPDVEVNQAMMTEHVLPVWVADQQLVYDTLETWAKTDPLLAGKIDLEHVGSFGHSFGGATSLEVCRVDPRCNAAIDLDGALYGGPITEPETRPVMLLTSSESEQFEKSYADWTQMVQQAQGPAYWLELPNSNHFAFTIMPLLSPILAPSGFNIRGGMQTENDYVRAFFDQTLRGADSPLLTPVADQTDVRWLHDPSGDQLSGMTPFVWGSLYNYFLVRG